MLPFTAKERPNRTTYKKSVYPASHSSLGILYQVCSRGYTPLLIVHYEDSLMGKDEVEIEMME